LYFSALSCTIFLSAEERLLGKLYSFSELLANSTTFSSNSIFFSSDTFQKSGGGNTHLDTLHKSNSCLKEIEGKGEPEGGFNKRGSEDWSISEFSGADKDEILFSLIFGKKI